MPKTDTYKVMYYKAYGVQHDALCFWCGETVHMNFTLSSFESKQRTAGCVHHLDHNHEHNVLHNLAGMHYGCHIAYHRSIRPLVVKGSKLPEEWTAKIAKAVENRMSAQANRDQMGLTIATNKQSEEGFGAELWCIICQTGPYLGPQGIRAHIGKNECGKKRERREELESYSFACSCGKRCRMRRSLVRHLNNHADHFEVEPTGHASFVRVLRNVSTYGLSCACGHRVKDENALIVHLKLNPTHRKESDV